MFAMGKSDMTSSGQPLESILVYRFNIYDLLRRIFLWELPLELFIDLVKAAKGEQGEGGSSGSPEAVFQDYLQRLPEEKLPELHRELHIEYTRLFVGPHHLPAPPYESVYRSPQRLMMRDETIDVRYRYAKNGFQVRRLNQEPDDMIGIELEFMCAVSKLSMDAEREHNYPRLAQLISEQREFCELHLSKWVPQFCGDIISNSRCEFWKSVAVFTRSFLEEETAELNSLADEVDRLARSSAASANSAGQ
jgi:TorA maturation chaperone TorD